MALRYGFNFTESDIRRLLERNDKQQSGIRSWRQLFGGASLGYNAQSDALLTDYSDIIREAYQANAAQNAAIMGAGLNVGATKDLLSASRQDLHSAYQTYIQNYRSNIGALSENYAKEVGTYETALSERARNFVDMYNSAYRYLAEELVKSPDYLNAQGLSQFVDTSTGNILPWSTVSEGFFNADASLTDAGRQFFDRMFNSIPQGYNTDEGLALRTFDQWLSDEDTKNNTNLRDWWMGQDDFNYTFAGTNRGTGMATLGLESTDQDYQASEYIRNTGFGNFQSPSTQGFDNALSNYENKFSSYLSAYRTLKNTKYSANQNSPEGTKYKNAETAMKNAQKEYQSAKNALASNWNAFATSIGSERDRVLDFLAQKVGPELYNAFVQENKSFVDSYNSLVNVNVESGNLSSESQILDHYNRLISTYDRSKKALQEYYRELIERIRTYVRQHSYTGVTSGF